MSQENSTFLLRHSPLCNDNFCALGKLKSSVGQNSIPQLFSERTHSLVRGELKHDQFCSRHCISRGNQSTFSQASQIIWHQTPQKNWVSLELQFSWWGIHQTLADRCDYSTWQLGRYTILTPCYAFFRTSYAFGMKRTDLTVRTTRQASLTGRDNFQETAVDTLDFAKSLQSPK